MKITELKPGMHVSVGRGHGRQREGVVVAVPYHRRGNWNRGPSKNGVGVALARPIFDGNGYGKGHIVGQSWHPDVVLPQEVVCTWDEQVQRNAHEEARRQEQYRLNREWQEQRDRDAERIIKLVGPAFPGKFLSVYDPKVSLSPDEVVALIEHYGGSVD